MHYNNDILSLIVLLRLTDNQCQSHVLTHKFVEHKLINLHTKQSNYTVLCVRLEKHLLDPTDQCKFYIMLSFCYKSENITKLKMYSI